MPSTASPLLALPTPLLLLISQHLPPSTKLSSLTHLHRLFPPLSIQSFSHDTLRLTIPIYRAFERSFSLRSLLSLITSLSSSLHQSDDEAFDANPLFPPFPLAEVASCFTRLISLRLSLHGDEGWIDRFLHSLFSHKHSFCHVTRLSLSVHVVSDERRSLMDWSRLPTGFPSLTSLTVGNVELDQQSFLLLCALPLDHLDLHTCTLYVMDHSTPSSLPSSSLNLLPVSHRWRSLLLPDSSASYDSVLCSLLSSYITSVLDNSRAEQKTAEAEEDKEETSSTPLLSHLSYNAGLTSATVNILSSLHSLHSLDLSSCDHLDLSAFYSVNMQPHLPLLRRFVQWRGQWMRTMSHEELVPIITSYVHFLSAYSSLHILELAIPSSSPYINIIVSHVLQLKQLRILNLFGLPYRVRSSAASGLPKAAHPQCLEYLHTLRLHDLPFFATDLGSLAALCPALEDCEVNNLPLMAADALLPLGQQCRKLRRVRIMRCNGDALRRKKATELNSAASPLSSSSSTSLSSSYHLPALNPSSVLFPHLRFLSLTPTPLEPILPLLFSSPLHYFDHASHTHYLPLPSLPLLSSLPHLRGVNTGRLALDGEMNHFFEVGKERGEEEEGDEGRVDWMMREEVKDDIEMKVEFMKECGGWREFVREKVFEGRDGREAFFESIGKEEVEGRMARRR